MRKGTIYKYGVPFETRHHILARVTNTVRAQVALLLAVIVALSGASLVHAVSPSGPDYFASPTTLSSIFAPYPNDQASVADPQIVDVNNDGRQDIVTIESPTNNFKSKVVVRLGDGEGGFAQVRTTAVPWLRQVELVDVNNDGILDASTITWTNNSTNPQNGTFETRLGAGDGTFAAVATQSFTVPSDVLQSFVSDVDNDNDPDIVASFPHDITGTINTPVADVFINDGAGHYTALPELSLSTTTPQKVLAATDFTNDGKPDLLVGSNDERGAIWFGDGQGGFTKNQSGTILGAGYNGYLWAQPAVADFTGDGLPDIAVQHKSTNTGADVGALRVYPNLGGGTFGAEIRSDRLNLPWALVPASVNADGFADIVAWSNNDLAVYLGNGSGGFTGVQQLATSAIYDVAIGRLNNDDQNDLLFGAAAQSPYPNAPSISLNISTPPDVMSPSVTGQADRQPDSGTWYNHDVTINWTAIDPVPSSGVPTVPQATVASAEGQDVEYTSQPSCDPVGNCATGTYRVSLDKTAPTLGTVVWSANPKTVTGNSALSVPVSDSLSGVVEGEYFIGTDPGQGNGATMTLSGSDLTTAFGTDFTPGVYEIGVRAKDAAGNWSAANKTMLVVYDAAGPGVTGKNKKDFVPQYGVDVLPGLVSATQTDPIDYGFTVAYRNGSLSSNNDLQFVYSTGSKCNTPNASNCHTFAINAIGFSWLVVDQANNSRARFQGVATVAVDGVTTTNPFTVTAVDGDLTMPAGGDALTLQVYAPGADPAIATPLYKVSGLVVKSNGVTIR